MISRTFNMRQLGREAFFQAVLEGDEIAREQLGDFERHIVQTGSAETTVQWIRKEPPAQAIIAFAGDVVQATTDINRSQRRMSNITGASFLGAQFRDQLAKVKGQLNDAGAKMQEAMKELSDTAGQATDTVKSIEAETADLKAALGLTSNNPPA